MTPGNHNSSLTILIFELTTLTIPILSPFLLYHPYMLSFL